MAGVATECHLHNDALAAWSGDRSTNAVRFRLNAGGGPDPVLRVLNEIRESNQQPGEH